MPSKRECALEAIWGDPAARSSAQDRVLGQNVVCRGSELKSRIPFSKSLFRTQHGFLHSRARGLTPCFLCPIPRSAGSSPHSMERHSTDSTAQRVPCGVVHEPSAGTAQRVFVFCDERRHVVGEEARAGKGNSCSPHFIRPMTHTPFCWACLARLTGHAGAAADAADAAAPSGRAHLRPARRAARPRVC